MSDNNHSKLKRKIAIYTLIFVLAGAPHGRPAEGQPVQSFVVSATGNVEAGDTEVGGKKVYLFIQC